MALTEQLMDADTFLARPETRWREELIDGRIVVNEPTMRHQVVVAQIILAIAPWAERAGRGIPTPPIDLRISDRTVLAPDLVWYADPGRADLDRSGQLNPPDLVVEVRSPSTWKYDIGVKSERYAEWGVGELWLTDPEARTVVVRRRTGCDESRFDAAEELTDDDTLTSPNLPGFALPVRKIFAVPGESKHQK